MHKCYISYLHQTGEKLFVAVAIENEFGRVLECILRVPIFGTFPPKTWNNIDLPPYICQIHDQTLPPTTTSDIALDAKHMNFWVYDVLNHASHDTCCTVGGDERLDVRQKLPRGMVLMHGLKYKPHLRDKMTLIVV